MGVIIAIARRELAAHFRTSAGWVITALFALLSGGVFLTDLTPGEPATMRGFFVLTGWLALLMVPAISMRLIAEERRTGSLEALTTAPISDWHIAFGKFAGAAACFGATLAPTLVFVAVLAIVSAPDFGPILAGYLGLTLLGGALVAIGLFFSSVSRSQVAALLASVLVVLLSQAAATIGAQAADRAVGAWLSQPLYALALAPRMSDFAKGVIDTGHVVFFVATAFWFTALTAMAMETRRWR